METAINHLIQSILLSFLIQELHKLYFYNLDVTYSF